MSEEELDKTFESLPQINSEEYVCDDNYSTLEENIESFNTSDVATINTDEDNVGPVYNYEWVDEVMQALNVSPDISNAFHVSRIFFI